MKSIVLAVALSVAASAVVSSPAYAWKVPMTQPPPRVDHHNGHTGKLVVGCIMGSAAGAIFAALRVSRTENRELTQGEAWTALSLCGLGSFLVAARPVAQPQRVVAKY